MSDINWKTERAVFLNKEFSVAFVKVNGRYMEFEDYRTDGGESLKELPPYSEFYGLYTNAQISNMAYPE